MNKMNRRRWLWTGLMLFIFCYIGTYLFLYSARPEQANRYRSSSLPVDYKFSFEQPFEELTIKTPQLGLLNALLFNASQSKGVVCFWKGNGGTLENWGKMAPEFLQFHYDVLITDYRQHGKSRGAITLANFYSDAQAVYDSLKQRYSEDKIIIIGYSLGGRVAARLAANNRPKLTLLIDPASQGGDFSDRVADVVYYPFPSVTDFVFPTERDVQQSRRPVVVVSTENTHSLAYQLTRSLTKKDHFVVIPGASHQTILTHRVTKQLIAQLLKS
ncbi:hypothetical protein BH09BAC4_BH09BAC4_13610 [soil metagenome]